MLGMKDIDGKFIKQRISHILSQGHQVSTLYPTKKVGLYKNAFRYS
jgi:hypothetical protein